MTDTPQNINIEGDLSAWLANVGGTITVYGDLTLNQWREQQPEALRAQTDAPIFISYSRANSDFAHDLYVKLRALGFALRRDRTEMAGGDKWWLQIQEAIRDSQTMVLCMSPKALASPVVADEWRYARREGTRVIPVLAEDVDFSTVPRWMAKLDWLDFREGAPEHATIWEKFINQLNVPHQRRPVPFTVPALPKYFVQREDVFEPLLAQLLDEDRQNPVAITTALQGGGGFGKTTMAMALAQDTRVRDAFDDGILWIEFGQEPDVLRLLNAQIRNLGGDGVETDINNAKAKLRDLLEDKDVLLILDDVWNSFHAQAFIQRTEKTRAAFMLTTRLQDVVSGVSAEQPIAVDEMDEAQSLALLSAGLDEADAHTQALDTLAQRLGEWALMLELANGVLRKQAGRYGLAEAIQRINEDLDDEGFTTFDPRNAAARNQSITQSLNVSLNLLEADERDRFAEVAIFREDTDIPLTTLAALWDMGERRALRLCETLADFLLVRFNPMTKTIRLHDVVRDLMHAKLDDPQAIHVQLIANYGDLTQLPDPYAWENLAYHLQNADQLDTLRGLLLNFDYLQNKLNATNSNALVADCDLIQADRPVQLVGSALSMSAHILQNAPLQLGTELFKRLIGHRNTHEAINILLNQIDTPYLAPHGQTFHVAGGALIRTLQHDSYVNDVAISGQYALSASDDNTVRVWNWRTGEHLRTLVGHTGSVNSVAVSGEYVLSASGNLFEIGDADNTIRVWNWHTGEHVRTLAHTDRVTSVALLGEYALSASDDATVRVWNWETGKHVRTLSGHTHDVTSVVLWGEYALSASDDKTVRVWNWHTGEHLRTLAGHTREVRSVVLSGEYALSASWDKTVRVWNWHTGKHVRTLSGHSNDVTSVVLWGEYALSASDDKTVRVWNWHTGEHLRTLAGHTGSVTSVVLWGEYALSASWDKTVRVWNWEAGKHIRTLAGHTNYVNSVVLWGEYALSASDDNTVRVWNWHTGEHLHTFYAEESLSTVAIAPNWACIVLGGESGQVHFLCPNVVLLNLLRGE